MMHCLDRTQSDVLIMQIYSANIFLALNCVTTDRSNQVLERRLIARLDEDIQGSNEFFYKAGKLIAYYSWNEHANGINYVKQLNDSNDGELYKIIGLMHRRIDSDLLIKLFLDALYTRSDNIVQHLVTPDKNSTLCCKATKAALIEYIEHCYRTNRHNMLILLLSKYEEHIDFEPILGIPPAEWINKSFNLGLNVVKYERKVLSQELSKDIAEITAMFFQYCDGNECQKRIALLLGKHLSTHAASLPASDVERIRKALNSRLDPKKLKTSTKRIWRIDRFIDDAEYLRGDPYRSLLQLEDINPYLIWKKKHKLTRFADLDIADRVSAHDHVRTLIGGPLDIDALLYIYMNTKLCELCSLEKFIYDVLNAGKCDLDMLMGMLSAYPFHGFVKRADRLNVLLRCTNVDMARLVSLPASIVHVPAGRTDARKPIRFRLIAFRNGNFDAELATE